MTPGSKLKVRPAKAADGKFSLISNEKLLTIYASMRTARLLGEHLSAHPPARGASAGKLRRGLEAMLASLTIDLESGDALSLAPEVSAAGILKGLPLRTVLQRPKLAKHAGLQRDRDIAGAGIHGLLPQSADTTAQLQIACGAAFAWKSMAPGKVVSVFCRASAVPSNGWREVLAFCSGQRLPLVLMAYEPSAGPNLLDEMSRGAHVQGVPLLTVDGLDAVAVYRVVFESLVRARQGRGPTLIVCRTGAYVTNRPGDPLRRMENYLLHKGLSPSSRARQAERAFRKTVAATSRQ
jgi:TPP-dependent pyruvate/acetoin dehydrogenase alpha subunit